MTPSNLIDKGNPVDNLSQLLDKVLRITILDARYFIGRFTCVDSKINLVLTEAEEFLPDPQTPEEKAEREMVDRYYPKSLRSNMDGPGWGRYAKYAEGDAEAEVELDESGQGRLKEGRMLGMILVPGKQIVKIELMQEKEEDLSSLIIW